MAGKRVVQRQGAAAELRFPIGAGLRQLDLRQHPLEEAVQDGVRMP
jgi:hypothetical protein